MCLNKKCSKPKASGLYGSLLTGPRVKRQSETIIHRLKNINKWHSLGWLSNADKGKKSHKSTELPVREGTP
jgi:hypothetical protein